MEDLEEFKRKLGLRIKTLRDIKKLTQPQLGALIGKDYQAISRIERGQVNPSAYLTKAIAEALDVEINELFLTD